MIEKIINYDNLTLDDIDSKVIRVKAVIINPNNEILLGYAHRTYQFPGGHLEDNEDINSGLERELNEELGITILVNEKPFMKTTYLTKNYRNTNTNRENDIYYYLIKEDIKPNMEESHLDSNELAGNYEPRFISLDKIDDILIKSIPDNPINEIIVNEMLEVLEIVRRDYV